MYSVGLYFFCGIAIALILCITLMLSLKKKIILNLTKILQDQTNSIFLNLTKILQDQTNSIFNDFMDLISAFLKRETSEKSFPILGEMELAQLERAAQEVWVVTTHLQNDVSPGPIMDSVEKNLERGVKYSYYLPDLNSETYQRCKRNLESYLKLPFVRHYLHRINVFHLPPQNIFLFSELIIYNPTFMAKGGKETLPSAYTYLDTQKDKLVKIPDVMLTTIINELKRLVSDFLPLSQLCDKLIRDLQDDLDNETIGELIRFREKNFMYKHEFDVFIPRLYKRAEINQNLTKNSITVIFDTLNVFYFSKHPCLKDQDNAEESKTQSQ